MKFAVYDISKSDSRISSTTLNYKIVNTLGTDNIVEFYKDTEASGIATHMVEFIQDGTLRGPGDCVRGSYYLPNEEKITNNPLGASWTYNASNYTFTSPLGAEPTPTDSEKAANKYYVWDEAAYQADNSTGWILETKKN